VPFRLRAAGWCVCMRACIADATPSDYYSALKFGTLADLLSPGSSRGKYRVFFRIDRPNLQPQVFSSAIWKSRWAIRY
jgi:hypothetical protein